MNKKYKAREGSPFPKREAQAIGKHIEKLQDNEKLIKPEYIVNDAKKKSSLLHPYFDWGNEEAAEKWRLQQARNIMNHIIEVVVIEEKEEEVRSYISVRVTEGTAYAPLAKVLSNKNYRNQIINQSLNTLNNLNKFLQILKEY